MGGCHSAVKKAFTGKGCNHTPKGYVDVMNDIVSQSIYNASNTVTAIAEAGQIVSIECDPDLPDGLEVFEANSACKTCMTQVFDGIDSQHAFERKLWPGTEAEVRLPINQEYDMTMDRIESCGQSVCKACVLVDASQKSFVDVDVKQFQTSEFKEAVNVNMSQLINSMLTNNQDVLSSLMSILGTTERNKVEEKIRTRIESILTQNFYQGLGAQIDSFQNIVINTSSSVRKIQQQTMFNVISRYVSDQNVGAQITTQQTLQTIASISNTQNTLGSAGQLVFQTKDALQKILGGTVGKIFLASVGFLALTVLCIILLIIYRIFSGQVKGKVFNEEVEQINIPQMAYQPQSRSL